jgi:hypothetical protein
MFTEKAMQAIEDCPVCRESGSSSHYHCPRCGGVSGIMAHYVGDGKPWSCESEIARTPAADLQADAENPPTEASELARALEAYGFRDRHGHPLENCVEYRNLRRSVLDELSERVKALIPDHVQSDDFDEWHSRAVGQAMEAMRGDAGPIAAASELARLMGLERRVKALVNELRGFAEWADEKAKGYVTDSTKQLSAFSDGESAAYSHAAAMLTRALAGEGGDGEEEQAG